MLSIKVGLVTVLLISIPAILLGYALARHNFKGKSVIDALVHLPLVLPPVVVGYLLMLLMGRNGAFGSWLEETLGIQIAFTWVAAALAAAVMSFPLMVRSIRISVELLDPKLGSTAQTLGAPWWDVFTSVTLPMIAPGILSGMTLAFARSLGEFGATITFAGNVAGETSTLPLAIYSQMQLPNGELQALPLVILSVLLSLGALYLSEWMSRNSSKRLGRTQHA